MRMTAMTGKRARVMTAYCTKDTLLLLLPVFFAARAAVSGLHPFGLSVFAALVPSPVGAAAMMLGAASLGTEGIKYIICTAFYLAFGYIKKLDRIAAGAVLGGIMTVLGICEALFFEPKVTDIINVAAEGISTGLLFYIFSSVSGEKKQLMSGRKREQLAAKLILTGAVISGFSGIVLPPGIMLDMFFGLLAVMLISGSVALGEGVTAAMVLGYMTTMSTGGDLTVVCMFSAVAMFSALLSELGRWAAVPGVLCGGAFVLLINGSIYSVSGYIGAIAAAVFIYSLIPEFVITGLKDRIRCSVTKYNAEYENNRLIRKIELVTKQHNEICARLKNMNEALSQCEKQAERQPIYSVTTAFAQRARGGGAVSGDCFSEFDSEKGKHYIMLCDGMGSGRKAYKESKMTTELLREFLRTGFLKDKAVAMLNSALAIRGDDESFSTVDLFEFDTYAGEAEFLKIGSAESFIRHKNEVETLSSSSLPVGILDEVRTVSVSRRLSVGDIVVMVSDGVGEADYGILKGEWIKRMIKNAGNDIKRLSEDILSEAVRRNFPEKDDDMTVVAIRIDRARKNDE